MKVIGQWAATISVFLAMLSFIVFGVYAKVANPDMADMRLFLTYWKAEGLLALWLFLSVAWFRKVI